MPSPKIKRLNKLHKIQRAAERKPEAFAKVAKNVGLSTEEPVVLPEPVVEEKVEELVVKKVTKTRRLKKTVKNR